LEAQARLIAAYEERKWPAGHRAPRILIRHVMDRHGRTRADVTCRPQREIPAAELQLGQ
jgi:hypothetical protein